jgi:hypothetical protein
MASPNVTKRIGFPFVRSLAKRIGFPFVRSLTKRIGFPFVRSLTGLSGAKPATYDDTEDVSRVSCVQLFGLMGRGLLVFWQ